MGNRLGVLYDWDLLEGLLITFCFSSLGSSVHLYRTLSTFVILYFKWCYKFVRTNYVWRFVS